MKKLACRLLDSQDYTMLIKSLDQEKVSYDTLLNNVK